MVKAICYERYGGIGKLHFMERPPAGPGPREVLVRVATAAINPIDWKLRQGQIRWIYWLTFPVTPGFDLCGTVLRCGRDVTEFQPGDRVCGMSNRRGGGALAEECLCSAEVLAKVPAAMSDEEAAGLPLAGLTALQGLRDHGRFASGMRVLVIGASGGVGHLAVQLAADGGGRVTAVCGPNNLKWVSELGAECVLNYREPDWLKEAGLFDLIFDAVGGLGLGGSLRHLKTGGSYVTTLPGLMILMDRWVRGPLLRRRARTFLAQPSAADMESLVAKWESGALRIRVDRVFDWREFAAAFARSEKGHARGKIVLRIGG
jgi:NADPH:quinone reductase-like Zn-dependent oxidoreductase